MGEGDKMLVVLTDKKQTNTFFVLGLGFELGSDNMCWAGFDLFSAVTDLNRLRITFNNANAYSLCSHMRAQH